MAGAGRTKATPVATAATPIIRRRVSSGDDDNWLTPPGQAPEGIAPENETDQPLRCRKCTSATSFSRSSALRLILPVELLAASLSAGAALRQGNLRGAAQPLRDV